MAHSSAFTCVCCIHLHSRLSCIRCVLHSFHFTCILCIHKLGAFTCILHCAAFTNHSCRTSFRPLVAFIVYFITLPSFIIRVNSIHTHSSCSVAFGRIQKRLHSSTLQNITDTTLCCAIWLEAHITPKGMITHARCMLLHALECTCMQ